LSRFYPDRPYVGVGVVVLREDEVLLVRRAKPPREGQWGLPGGAQEIGETVYEAGRREVMEETGLEIEVLGLIDVVDAIRRDEDGRVQYHFTLVDLFARWISGQVRAGDDAAEAAWFALAEVGELGVWSETERIVRLADEKRQVLRSESSKPE